MHVKCLKLLFFNDQDASLSFFLNVLGCWENLACCWYFCFLANQAYSECNDNPYPAGICKWIQTKLTVCKRS